MRAKQVLRQQRRRARHARPQLSIDPGRAGPILDATGVAGYLALPSEPDPAALLAALTSATVLLPRIEDETLTWIELTEETTFSPGPYGIQQPAGLDATDRLPTLDVILLPALAVDTAGHRLGQGGGFYDRALAAVPRTEEGGPLRVAVVYDEEVLREVPTEAHDQTIDAALTPTRFLNFRQDAG